MPGGLKKYLEEIADKRVEELRYLIGKNSNRYEKLKVQAYELQQEFMATLTEEQQGMFVKLEDFESEQSGIVHDMLYRYAFRDGVKAVRMMFKCK
ncbi:MULTISPECIES: DUF6809 family protein [Pseudobacteroides]|uniref:Uncharacterized protein n=1 Tax=Pseudobacteroides cellulosolvens ATCC 35603 = DSM 2933 TaxID=398512 RepID=A0A0L6JTG5_9FIRM|nr:DUF6809 family protein [Pseudobacteroides cellulosolvens]KNY29009.1 hypothetical protein Bccel_4283 [Pseudobacteroides cellulosolvens ATCC 35603 = DSM 2933]